MPRFKFSDTAPYRYRVGHVFLGRDQETGRDIGMKLEKHGIVVATTRTGKGAGFIIPNLKRWPDSVVIVDPKGENCVETWRSREAMGQTIALLDPFHAAKLPEGARDRFRCSFNPLEGIGANTRGARERLAAIANALVPVYDQAHMEWVHGCRSIIAGACAYTVATVPPDARHLGSVRGLLKLDEDRLRDIAAHMIECDACGGLASAAGGLILKALRSDKGLPHQFLDKARTVTEWLDSPELSATLAESSFSLTQLVENKLSVYLVLPPDEIETYSAYLRLFIQSMLRGITESGTDTGCNCLFILDEFYSLGKFDKIAEVMGRMAGYGVHVVPVIQNIGQIQSLYGKETNETFFGNAEFKMFFGDGDTLTLNYISTVLGNYTISEVEIERPVEPTIQKTVGTWDYVDAGIWPFTYQKKVWSPGREYGIEFRAKMTEYHAAMAWAGKPRMPPTDLAALIGKPVGYDVAKSAIVFAKAGDVLNINLAPFYLERDYVPEKKIREKEAAERAANAAAEALIAVRMAKEQAEAERAAMAIRKAEQAERDRPLAMLCPIWWILNDRSKAETKAEPPKVEPWMMVLNRNKMGRGCYQIWELCPDHDKRHCL